MQIPDYYEFLFHSKIVSGKCSLENIPSELDGSRLSNPEELLPADALMVLEHAYEGTPLNRKKVKKGGRRVNY